MMIMRVFSRFLLRRLAVEQCSFYVPSPSSIHITILLQGANFRDLKGVRVGANNIVEWDPEIERVYLSSGKPLVWFNRTVLYRVLMHKVQIFMLHIMSCYKSL